jgi:transposase
MGGLPDFQRGQMVGAHLAGVSITKPATLLDISRAAVSGVIMTYTTLGKTSSTKKNGGRKPKLSERYHCTLKRIVSIKEQLQL